MTLTPTIDYTGRINCPLTIQIVDRTILHTAWFCGIDFLMKFLLLSFRRLACAGLFVLAILSVHAAEIPLASSTNTWRFHKGTNAPQSDWKTVLDGGLNAAWPVGSGGFGYADNANETNLCRTILSDMRTLYTTVYIRQSFDYTNAVNTNLHLLLTMDWDDGFIVWLNGNKGFTSARGACD